MRSISAAEIRRHIGNILRQEQSAITKRLQQVAPGLALRTISDSFTRNVTIDGLPAIMFDQNGTSSQWEAMPNLMRREFRLTIWGYIHWNDDDVLDDAVAEFAAGVEEALLARHRPTPIIGSDVMVYYDSTTPITGVSFGTGHLSGTVVRGFSANFNCHILQAAPDYHN